MAVNGAGGPSGPRNTQGVGGVDNGAPVARAAQPGAQGISSQRFQELAQAAGGNINEPGFRSRFTRLVIDEMNLTEQQVAAALAKKGIQVPAGQTALEFMAGQIVATLSDDLRRSSPRYGSIN
jgi:hypothetical protein